MRAIAPHKRAVFEPLENSVLEGLFKTWKEPYPNTNADAVHPTDLSCGLLVL